MSKKKYYFPNDETADGFYFGGETPICFDLAALKCLAEEWEMPLRMLRADVHEATPEEIREYGVYDFD